MKEEKNTPKQIHAEEPALDQYGMPITPFRDEMKRIIKSSGITVAKLAEQMQIDRQSLDFQLRGNKRVKPEIFKGIMKAIEEISRQAGRKMSASIRKNQDGIKLERDMFTITPGALILFPIIRSLALFEGKVDLTNNNIVDFSLFPWLEKEQCFGYIIKGDEMTDNLSLKSLNDGDYVLIDPKIKIISGDFVALRLKEGRDLIRMVLFNPGDNILLKTLNPRYPDLEIDSANIEWMGRICMKHSKHTTL